MLYLTKSHNNLLHEFKSICKSIKYSQTKSITKRNKIIDAFKSNFNYPLLRGILLEDIIIQKVLLLNKLRSIYRLEGKGRVDRKTNKLVFKLSSANHKFSKTRREAGTNLKENLLIQNALKLSKLRWYNSPANTFNSTYFEDAEVKVKQLKSLKANKRCLAKVSIDYCFIDLIIDEIIIDIKTDNNSKCLKKYLRQVFIQAVMYSSFLKQKKQYRQNLSPFDIEMINIPMNGIAIYYWRSNEFFKYNITDLLPINKYKRLVNIYAQLYNTHATELREIIRKYIFR
jgi:hypothetical protein